MAFFTRLSNGWKVAKASFSVLNAHKELIIFPVLSGLSILLVLGSFVTAVLYRAGWDTHNIPDLNGAVQILLIFLFYIFNYFVIIFFNMALMHCAKLFFEGEEVSIAKGLRFSAGRAGAIFSWVIFAATVGVVLKIIQDNLGWLGQLLTGLAGFAWSVTTFFVIPVIAYEHIGPLEAMKHSAKIMKEKWGEGIGANFSIGFVMFFVFLVIAVAAMAISALVNEQAGIVMFVAGALLVMLLGSTLHNIFICAIYLHIDERDNPHIDQQLLDDLFVEK
jgi:hypothetical protein